MNDKIIINGKMELAEFKGKFSLVAVREYNGKYYQQWGKLELGSGDNKRLADKSQPFKVMLGDSREEAITAVKELLNHLGATSDDVPF